MADGNRRKSQAALRLYGNQALKQTIGTSQGTMIRGRSRVVVFRQTIEEMTHRVIKWVRP